MYNQSENELDHSPIIWTNPLNSSIITTWISLHCMSDIINAVYCHFKKPNSSHKLKENHKALVWIWSEICILLLHLSKYSYARHMFLLKKCDFSEKTIAIYVLFTTSSSSWNNKKNLDKPMVPKHFGMEKLFYLWLPIIVISKVCILVMSSLIKEWLRWFLLKI